jgi:hypothetical protein
MGSKHGDDKVKVEPNGISLPPGNARERDTPVVRLHLRSTVGHVIHSQQEEFCLAESGWAGVGWGCWDDTPSGISWADYEAHSGKGREERERTKEVNESVRLLRSLPNGTFVWTRRQNGIYWLGELTGGWEYRGDEQARKLDLFNLRPCRWWQIGTEDAVPGKVVNNFRARKTLNRVKDAGAARYTCRLHAQLTGIDSSDEPVGPREMIESLLGPEDLEDLVAVYLQDRFDLVLVSRGKCTPGYEYVLRHRSTGRRAVASVKSGATPVKQDRLPKDADIDAYVYAVSGNYEGPRSANVRVITTAELADFVVQRRVILPDQVARWLE